MTKLESTMQTNGRIAKFSKQHRTLEYFTTYNTSTVIHCETVKQARDKIAAHGVGQILETA